MTPVSLAVVTMGAEIAERLIDADKRADYLSGRAIDLRYSKKAKERALASQVSRESDAAWSAYHKVAEESKDLHGLPKQVQATVSWTLTGSGYVTSVMGTQDEKRYDSLDEAKAAAEVQLRTILTNALKAIS